MQTEIVCLAQTNFQHTNNTGNNNRKKTMPKLNEIFSGNYLKADDLQGRTVRVTISKAEVKDFDDGNKVVLHFQGKDKLLVANKTNCSIIAENVGTDNTDEWAGQTISLFTKKVEFQGKLVPAIRVVLEEKKPAPAAAAPKPTVADVDGGGVDDDVGF